MPSSLTKGGRGPKNFASGDRYDHNAFDRNLQDEIFQMTYARNSVEMGIKKDVENELSKFREARSKATLEEPVGKKSLLAKTAQKDEEKKEDKKEPTATVAVKVAVKVAKKKRKKHKDKKKKSKKQKKEKEEPSSALAGLVGGYDSDSDAT
eukprot:CAMPEP_0197515364 /NCGR_PEP_ID=MMETSP1318-20131121/529_1 /TAXON_ID=552666 /ORGANISM="Partenskyella glossopodia, Strain RCC365" /LENGTH=150 /DNA_ID=CAMNT_0043063723 /DNA_START=6 /DNA_END=454 /DNA_ORIENTATION=+